MDKKIIIRIIFDIVLFFTVINGQWLLALPLVLFGVWYWPTFIEIIVAGVMYDALFGMTQGQGLGGWIGTLIAIVLYTITLPIKKFVRR